MRSFHPVARSEARICRLVHAPVLDMGTILVAAELQELLEPDAVSGHDIEWLDDTESTPAGPYNAVVPLLSRRIGARELDGWPALRIVANCAVGYDNVDLVAAAARGIAVSNTPGVLTESTADLTWALILALTRRLKEGQELIASGRWTGWHPTQLLGLELRGSTLGIVGAGRIGQAVARRARGFGMAIGYTARSRKPSFERETGARQQRLEELLPASDVVTVHVPSTPETRPLFDAERLAQLKRGAFFVNTARGDVVNEDALIAALNGGAVGGAGLDVFAAEPRVPRALIEHPRVITLPHIGSATTTTRRAMADLALRNVRAVLAGRPPLTPVLR